MVATTLASVGFRNVDEIEEVVRGFQWCTLERERWTHAAHLTVALWYHLRLQPAEAEQMIREGIKRFNQAHGVARTPTGAYHETITLFWIRMVRKFLGDVNSERLSVVALFNQLIERFGKKELPLEYYSRELLMSWEARTTWVEPDLKSLA